MTRKIKMTEERRALFLKHLSIYGIVGLAAEHASPGCGLNHCRTTFYEERAKNEQFAKDWDAALDHAEDLILKEMHRRGIDGVEEEVFGSLGNNEGTGVVGKKIVYSDRMLELYSRVKSARVRAAMTNKTELAVSGSVNHEIGLASLSPENQDLLSKILESEVSKNDDPPK